MDNYAASNFVAEAFVQMDDELEDAYAVIQRLEHELAMQGIVLASLSEAAMLVIAEKEEEKKKIVEDLDDVYWDFIDVMDKYR